MTISLKTYLRALRLPFITASTLPFIAGSLIDKHSFDFFPFLLGLFSVIFTHLGANLINDYTDSKSGADWQDKKFYKFFGGSKLIQEGILSNRFYINLAILFFLAASLCVFILSILFKGFVIVGYFFLILFLGFSYSHKPFEFSYHRLGEFIIFILFGPAVVMGGYFIQTQLFPTLKGFILSLPFGFFTTAILFSNEIPDRNTDIKAGKFTWASIMEQGRAFIIYCILVFFGYLTIILNISLGYLSPLSLLSLLFIVFSLKAINTLKQYSNYKTKLISSSKLTIAVQALVGLILILDLIL